LKKGDRKLTISFPGRKSINSYVRFVNGYQLVIEADLVEEKTIAVQQTQTTPTPLASQTTTATVTIKDTETGWLRVRDTPSSAGLEVAKVTPNEKYKIIEEKPDWYKIELGVGKSGWVSAKYVDKS
jgi:uncharacterized protein YgiM (DUF1202 family)